MNIDWTLYLHGLCAILALGFAGWVISLIRRNVTHVDSMWSLFFVAALFIYQTDSVSVRSDILLAMVLLWAMRLFAYLTWRNWGPHEDHRYLAIRKNNEPNFQFKSLYIIFGLQALLAWIISLPLFAASQSVADLNLWDYLGCVFWLLGFAWETLADWQLAIFKSNPNNHGKVLNTGLWRLSRHPNYFGECCLWWGYYLIACAAGGWWTIPAPLLMTLLLLKVSGVALLEKDITDRRPDYAKYKASTNAFLPCWKQSRKE